MQQLNMLDRSLKNLMMRQTISMGVKHLLMALESCQMLKAHLQMKRFLPFV